jgi:hypothetical protein
MCRVRPPWRAPPSAGCFAGNGSELIWVTPDGAACAGTATANAAVTVAANSGMRIDDMRFSVGWRVEVIRGGQTFRRLGEAMHRAHDRTVRAAGGCAGASCGRSGCTSPTPQHRRRTPFYRRPTHRTSRNVSTADGDRQCVATRRCGVLAAQTEGGHALGVPVSDPLDQCRDPGEVAGALDQQRGQRVALGKNMLRLADRLANEAAAP